MDDALRAQHPDTITIVLQHQFADLEVRDDSFSVTLFFGGKTLDNECSIRRRDELQ